MSSSLTVDLFAAMLKKSAQMGVLFGLFYLGATYHTDVARWERGSLYRHLKVEDGFFPDPEGLELVIRLNERGNLTPYLTHGASGAAVPLTLDFFETYREVKK